MRQVLFLTKIFLKNLFRQPSIVFSSIILPLVVLWSTWWVTADLPMTFELANAEQDVSSSMIDVHVVTGSLTAMAITAGLFGFIITNEYRKISDRLELVGYSPTTTGFAIFLSLFVTLSFSIVITVFLANFLAAPKDPLGLTLAIVLVSLIYVSLGNLVAIIIPKATEGTLILLIVAFIDLMVLTNPMGGGVYLESWTYYLPGFWPIQVALEASFLGNASVSTMVYPLIYFVLTVILILFVRNARARSTMSFLSGGN